MTKTQAALPHVQEAAAQLLRCWDCLNVAEKIVDQEITTEMVGKLCAGLDDPSDAFSEITVEHVDDMLRDDSDPSDWIGQHGLPMS